MFFKKLCLLLALSAAVPSVLPSAAARPEPRESCSGVTGLCWPILKLGSRGEKVRTLQILLKSRGLSVAPDGSFGSATQSAVRTLQRRNHLRVDGLVGAQTWEQVVPVLKRGARGQSVGTLQLLINSLNKHSVEHRNRAITADGFYGLQTEREVQYINEAMSFDDPPPGTGSRQAGQVVWCVLLGGHFDGE